MGGLVDPPTRAAAVKGPFAINDVIYALSVRFEAIEALENVLNDAGVAMNPCRVRVFLAGKVFQRYRARGVDELACCRTSSSVRMPRWRARLLTRDSRRYRRYFRAIDLITP